MAPRIVDGVSELVALVGEDLGHSGWFTVSQERVDAFIASTDSGQWIHAHPAPTNTEGLRRSTGMNGDCAGIGAVTISTGSPEGRAMRQG